MPTFVYRYDNNTQAEYKDRKSLSDEELHESNYDKN